MLNKTFWTFSPPTTLCFFFFFFLHKMFSRILVVLLPSATSKNRQKLYNKLGIMFQSFPQIFIL